MIHTRRNTLPHGLPPVTPLDEAFKIIAPDSPEGWEALKRVKKRDLNDIVHEINPDGRKTQAEVFDVFNRWMSESPTLNLGGPGSKIVSLRELRHDFPDMRKEVISGLLRRGEIMNIVASPKSNKSWLGMNVALCIIGGGELFGMRELKCERGRVLIVDNELHKELIAWRGLIAAEGLSVPPSVADGMIDYLPLRGELVDINTLESYLEGIVPGSYQLIILDALYKFYPERFDEGSNADFAKLYNKLDYYAMKYDCALAVVHHSSKGNQTGRVVTDVGAGGGAQSRACDTHLVIRPAEGVDGIWVFDVVKRSFKPMNSFCCRFKFPRWEVDRSINAEDFKAFVPTGKGRKAKAATDGKQAESMDEFFSLIVNEPTDAKTIILRGYGRNFQPWHKDHLQDTILPNMIAAGKVKITREASGNKAALYVWVKPEERLCAPSPVHKSPDNNDNDDSGDQEGNLPF